MRPVLVRVHRRLGPAGAHVTGTHVLGHAMHQGAGAEFVGRHQHHEPGEAAGERDVFHGHLAGTVFADGNSAVRADKLGVHAGIGDGNPKLVVALVHQKHGER